MSHHSKQQRKSAPGEAVRPGAKPPLGILRNRYAEPAQNGSESAANAGEKSWDKPDKKEARQEDRFTLQRTAAAITPLLRVAHCLWTATSQSIELLRRGGDARFSGVQTCGSVWGCPCCSARISEVRRQELRVLQKWVAERPGLRIVMMTLTARHRNRKLESLLERMAAAKARMQNRNPWKPLRLSGVLVGSVSVREATHGENGWHPHYHVLCVVKAGDDEAAIALLEPLRRVWVECLKLEGLGGTLMRAFHLATGDTVAEYPNKIGKDLDQGASWGIAEEMTLGRLKRGRGEKGASPWQVLREAQSGDDDAKKLWREYATTMHGRRQQVWSNGLKEAVGLVEIEDEDAAAGEEYTQDPDELLHTFDIPEWHRWRPFRARLLGAARRGPEAVSALLGEGLPVSSTGEEEQVIDDDIDHDPEPMTTSSATILRMIEASLAPASASYCDDGCRCEDDLTGESDVFRSDGNGHVHASFMGQKSASGLKVVDTDWAEGGVNFSMRKNELSPHAHTYPERRQ